jgi:hypothetical protein
LDAGHSTSTSLLSKIKREERMFFYGLLQVPEKITSKRKTAAGRKTQHLIQLLRTRIFGTGRATEIICTL